MCRVEAQFEALICKEELGTREPYRALPTCHADQRCKHFPGPVEVAFKIANYPDHTVSYLVKLMSNLERKKQIKIEFGKHLQIKTGDESSSFAPRMCCNVQAQAFANVVSRGAPTVAGTADSAA